LKQHHVTRRSIIKAGAGLAGLAALGTRSALAADTRLRMFWWGTKERADRTEAANKLYSERNPGVTIDGESVGWNDYWPRLATQSAGRNAADIIQMDYRYIFEYAPAGRSCRSTPISARASTSSISAPLPSTAARWTERSTG